MVVIGERPGERLLYLLPYAPEPWMETTVAQDQSGTHLQLVSCWYERPTGVQHCWLNRVNLYRPDDPEVWRISLLLAAGYMPEET